jgi:hypothetical protein
MSESFVTTVPFESKYAWILANAENVRGNRVMHRIPTDVILDLGQLKVGKILDRPTTCTPYNPNNPDIVPDVSKVETWALVKSAVIPPLPYPETFGGVIKEQNERWFAVEADLHVVYVNGELASWHLDWNQESISELTPDDFLLVLAKETIQDNAKQEYVKAYGSDRQLKGFGTLVDRDKTDRNIWKEQYVMKTLGLPLYLKPKAYIPKTESSTLKITYNGEETSLNVTLPGADQINYKDDVGSGESSARAGQKDSEACCRCYNINAIVKPYMHVVDTPLQAYFDKPPAEDKPGRPSDDTTLPTGNDELFNRNWNALMYNFFLANLLIEAKENTWNAVDTKVAVTGIMIDGSEATLFALRNALGQDADDNWHVTTTDTPPIIQIKFPATRSDLAGEIVLHLVFLYKIDILKMDIFLNDDLISHIYCSSAKEFFGQPITPYTKPVQSAWVASYNEGQ